MFCARPLFHSETGHRREEIEGPGHGDTAGYRPIYAELPFRAIPSKLFCDVLQVRGVAQPG